ncbi:chemotaxis protein CheB [Thiorhodococcus minor]|uniref:histidine kinase n=1 Tax=Thiorhodococcus minor TaxID=57489 RepID=A0A6M0K4V8_9GAMM|nr:chemotaxis protein CheB [Thiorhodococcus minor]NEV64798.1 PAS domain-containing protein [Thiorhodococcus minor]
MDQTDPGPEAQAPTPPFPIVGIGASAGGLEALRALFQAMPKDTGAGFVLVQHLDPTHDSLMAELLSKYAQLSVVQVSDGMEVAPNQLYVIPPNAAMTIADGVLHLSAPTERRGLRMPIDRFFSSLADDRQESGIGIVLSGTGTDGTYGVRLIKARGGMVLAQDPSTAAYDGMPRSAIGTGDVDYALPVEEMPHVLKRYIEHFRKQGGRIEEAKQDQDYLDSILALLIARESCDFRCYKRGTLHRRILRRMGLAHVPTLAAYHARLRDDGEEVRALGKDLPIGVTELFREPEAWAVLREEVLPALFARIGKREEAVRAWVPGCATGEEAYSLAMILAEAAEAEGRANNLIVFATDVAQDSLEVARAGIYAESLVANVDPERLKRFFTRGGDRYQVKKSLREKVIFAPQNLLTDPPFSSLSLISCRNLLIYIEPEHQDRILSLFHFSLRKGGYLFLGNSETAGQDSRLFTPLSKKWRIYQRIDTATPSNLEFPSEPSLPRRVSAAQPGGGRRDGSYGALTQKTLIEHFTPASVLVDRAYHVLYFHGPVRDYLGPAPGEPTDELLQLAAEGVRGKLRNALRQAASEQHQVVSRGAHIRRGEQWYQVVVTVTPIRDADASAGLLLVSFQDEGKHEGGDDGEMERHGGEDALVRQLEEELKGTRDDLRSTIEQMETSNEELKASNEEDLSMNEELQSTNEELETSKEELQSLNEELTTLNSQLEDKVTELEEINNDLSNLLVSTEIATVFLDRYLRIRRYTPAVGDLMRLIPSDIGRLVTDITWSFEDEALLADARAVIAGQTAEPYEMRSQAGRWFLRRVAPYRTEDSHTEGVVVTFTDITQRKRMEVALRQSESHLRRITDSLPVLISYIDRDYRYRSNNAVYKEWFGVDPEAARGKCVPDVLGDEAFAAIRPHMDEALAGSSIHLERWVEYAQGGKRYVSADYIPDVDENGEILGFFALVTDLTERHLAEERLEHLNLENRRHLDEIQALLEAAPVGIFFARDRACQDMVMNSAGAQMLRIASDRNPSKSGPDAEELRFRVFHDGRELAADELPMQIAATEGRTISGFEEVIQFADGSQTELLTYAAPLFDEQGEVRGCVGTLVDVTEQKRLEARLRERTQQLEQADRRKDQFLAMLGHELRNPLAPIRSTVQLMRMGDGQSLDVAGAADMIDRQVVHLERMVADLLDLARVRRGMLNLSIARHHLQELVQESVNALSQDADAKQQWLSVAFSEEPLFVLADGTRLTQVFSNLLRNAVRYTPEGGHIQVSIRREDSDRARIDVEDDGKGIPSDLLPHVFDIFDKAPSHPERTNAGLGLGLTLVRQIVDMHKGEVEAASDGPGKGACFSVSLPLLTEAYEAGVDHGQDGHGTHGAIDAAKQQGETLDILIVDDNADVLAALAGLLERLGHRVRTLESGAAVLPAVREAPPDLLLLDLGLPDVDGYKVARELAEEPCRQRIKVVAVTGYAETDPPTTAQSTRYFDARLLKPLTLSVLQPHLSKR